MIIDRYRADDLLRKNTATHLLLDFTGKLQVTIKKVTEGKSYTRFWVVFRILGLERSHR